MLTKGTDMKGKRGTKEERKREIDPVLSSSPPPPYLAPSLGAGMLFGRTKGAKARWRSPLWPESTMEEFTGEKLILLKPYFSTIGLAWQARPTSRCCGLGTLHWHSSIQGAGQTVFVFQIQVKPAHRLSKRCDWPDQSSVFPASQLTASC